MSIVAALLKDPDATALYDVDFSSIMTTGESLVLPTVTASPTGLTIGTPAVSGGIVQFSVAGGTSGTLYRINVHVTTDGVQIYDEEVKLLVQNTAWMPEMVRIVRHLINDLADSPTYADIRLGELILVAAQQVIAELTFDQTYSVNVDSLSLSPDPTAGTRDDDFIHLTCLKAACILDLGAARARAGMAGINVKDSMGSISTNVGLMDGFKLLFAQGACAMYTEAKKQYQFGSMRHIRAILTPFSGRATVPYGQAYRGDECEE
jgi:hypothetical protein